mgnify:CR=1 FL=1
MIMERLGLRARLYLASGSILLLFAFNVGTHLWGSYARSESVLAYRDATEATTLVRNIEQGLSTENQRVQVLAALRETNAPIGETQREQANDELTSISAQLRSLGGLSNFLQHFISCSDSCELLCCSSFGCLVSTHFVRLHAFMSITNNKTSKIYLELCNDEDR